MGVLQRFERRLGGLVEGAFARVFKDGVEPVEIAGALAREVDDRRAVGPTRTLVPNDYVVELSPPDHDRLGPYEGPLTDELAEIIREHVAERSYSTVGPVTVRLERSDDLDLGVFRIRSGVTGEPQPPPRAVRPEPLPPPPAAPEPPPPPRPVTPPDPRTTSASLVLLTQPGIHGQARDETVYPLVQETVRLGRAHDCDVRLTDTGVSRHHAELRYSDDAWRITDLASTNGTTVNGTPVRTARLVDGDRLSLAGTELVFRAGRAPTSSSGTTDGPTGEA